MNTPPPETPVSPLNALARRWKLGAGLGLLGLALGAGYGQFAPTSYTAEARLAVGSQSLEARAVAGYSQASQQLAADFARYVNDQRSQSEVRASMGPSATTITGVAASPIPESSVIRIEVFGSDGAAASTAATSVAQSLADRVNAATASEPEALLAEYTTLSQRVAQEEVAVAAAQREVEALGPRSADEDVAAAEQRLSDAESALAVSKVQQTAIGERYRNAVTASTPAGGLQVVSPGTVTSDGRTPQMLRFGVLGLGVGLVLALVLASLAERRRARRSTGSTGTGDAGASASADRDQHLPVDLQASRSPGDVSASRF